MKVEWVVSDEFPNYTISSEGDVVNQRTGKLVHKSYTQQGGVKVNLIVNGFVHTKSVTRLVAECYVLGRDEIFDTPIQLDGDYRNTRVENIVWRPRWFAWKYKRQFSDISKTHRKGPIFDTKTRSRYADVYEASITHGLLFKDVWRSIHLGEPVFPTWQKFELVR